MALQHLRSSTANKRPTPAAMSDGQIALNSNTASPGLFFKDSAGALIKVGPVHVGTTAPNASPASGGETGNTVGEQWLDTTGGTYVFKVWDGSAWRSETGTFVDVNGDTMTGALGIIAGDAATPGLFVSGDTNTGIYSPGADQLAISTNGTGRLFVDANGRLGVGTAGSTIQSALHVSKAGAEGFEFIPGDSSNTNITLQYNRSGAAWCTNEQWAASHIFRIQSSEVARIDNSGRLLVGTSTSSSTGNAQYAYLQIKGGAGLTGSYIALLRAQSSSMSNGSHIGGLTFGDEDGNEYARFACESDAAGGSGDYPGCLIFSTTADGVSSPTERMRIFNGGNITTFSSASAGIDLSTSSAAGTTNSILRGYYGATSITSAATLSFRVWSNGDVQNTNNSYGAISDIKLKENIVDASSQWGDLKALRVVNYNFKEGQTHTQIGLIAQEVELVSPGLVTESPDRDADGNDLGTTTKSVNYSVLYMKAVKALQEAMERIEVLEAKVNALEGN